ncbi:MAG: GGDEF domain-containing protein [Candidatus Aminicenantes bacterium]|nr:GGDEF domain-containing protein [Candidatus Aminicenantes bacterium]
MFAIFSFIPPTLSLSLGASSGAESSAGAGGGLIPVLLIVIAVLAALLVWAVAGRAKLKANAQREIEAAHRDIRERQTKLSEAYKTMEDMARTDAMTDLPNRRDMMENLEEEKVRFERNRRPFTVVLVDLDRFKVINDIYGQGSGDYLLKSCASLLRASLRRQDRVGRWSGDEFLLLLPGTDQAGGRTIIETIRKRVAETTFSYGGRVIKAGLSLGMIVYRGEMSLDDFIRQAFEALAADRKKKSRTP